jgi:hypothetical protein
MLKSKMCYICKKSREWQFYLKLKIIYQIDSPKPKVYGYWKCKKKDIRLWRLSELQKQFLDAIEMLKGFITCIDK